MDNQYIKQFPDLLSGKKIMYIHGFGVSAQSGTVRCLREALPGASVVARDVPIHPTEAMEMLRRMCEDEKPDLIIGTSMGGMYAEMMHGYNRILVNPALQMGETMREHGMMGRQTFQAPRADGATEFIVTKGLIKEYKDITEQCFSSVTPEEQGLVYGLFGDKDDIVHTFDLFHEHYPNAMRFHGGHLLNDHSLRHAVMPVIRWISDKLEGRKRDIIYISIDALVDQYGKPKSSVTKAYEALTGKYNVFIVAPAHTNDHARITRTQEWVEQYISTPAYDRVIFTNRKDLLYGDFLIDPTPPDALLCTPIELGGDKFKTWEDVMTYFERLG